MLYPKIYQIFSLERRSTLVNIILIISAIFLPIVLWKLDLPIISYTQRKNEQIFELFGFFSFIAISSITYQQIKRQTSYSFKKLFPILAPALLSLFWLYIITEYPNYSADYRVYEQAAQAISQGSSPYIKLAINKPYTYPPLLAVTLSSIAFIIKQLMINFDQNTIWYLVFYIYQCVQFLLIPFTYFICLKFAQNIGLKLIPASFLVSLLLLINNPLLRTIKWNQVNLWILNSFLIAILLLQRYPIFSGILIAFGYHLKVYPAIMLLPWGLTRQWRGIAGIVIGFFAFILMITQGLHNWEIEQDYLNYFLQSQEKPTKFRNNSINSLIINLFKFTGISSHFVKITVILITLGIVIWWLWRFWKREQFFAQVNIASANCFRLYSHEVDTLALSLLISPSVWEHHYLIAIPIAIWASAIHRFQSLQVWLGILLIFGVPNFDIFPFSYNHLLGLILLMLATSSQDLDYFKHQSRD